MSKEIFRNEPKVKAMSEVEMVDTDSIHTNTIVVQEDMKTSYPSKEVAIIKSKQESNANYGMEVTRRMSPLAEAFQGAGTSPLFLELMQKNPDIILRKSSFDGMGVPVKSQDLEGKTAYLYECEILDYDAINDNGEMVHYHYSAWLGRLDETQEAFVYSAGKQLTELAEVLLLPENNAVKEDVSLRGIHVKFNMIKLKSDPRKSFMKVDVIP